MAQNPPKTKESPEAQALEEQREETQKSNAKAMHRMDSSQPTPTQEENDLAKLGIHVQPKADDKSGPTVIERSIVANEPLPHGGYETRSAKARRESLQREAHPSAERHGGRSE